MIKRLALLFLLLFIISAAYGQRWKLKRYEAVAGFGVANVFGDIGGASERETFLNLKDYRIKDSRPSLNLGVRYRIKEEQALKLNIIMGYGSGTDEGGVNETIRTYKFSTFMFEPSVQYEYYFLREDRNTRTSAMFSRRGMVNTFNMISAYAFAGAGGLLYMPKVEGTSTYPQADHLDESTGFTPVIPIGMGVKYVISSEVSLNLELGRRFAFSDLVDGITTDFSKANDVYYFGTLSVVYKLTTSRRGIPIIFEGGRQKGRSGASPSRGRRPIGL